MMHFFRRSKIHIDCFTHRRDVIEYAPVVNAIEVIPEWWKALPKERRLPYPAATMKTCIGMLDYYNKSIAMPLWSDLYIQVENKEYIWQFSDKITDASIHPTHQYAGFVDNNYGHLKIHSPWLFFTKQSVDWVVTAPVYNRVGLDTFTIAEGLLNFSKQNSTNIQLFLPLHTNKEFIIPFKTPFMLTPMADKKVVVHRHLVAEKEFLAKESASFATTFINKYKAHEHATKCPFHNHVGSK